MKDYAMLNFSGISGKSLLGRLLRLPLKLLPSTLKVPILQGPLRGYRWIVGSGLHGYWLGSYEAEKQKQFVQAVQRDWVVYDVGAHVGLYTLLASVIVGEGGRVVCFEPVPRNAGYVRQHVEINHLTNVTVIEAAVSEKSGSARFAIRGTVRSMGSLSADGDMPVQVVRLDDLYEDGTIPLPHVIKMDIEGAELSALRGATRIISEAKPMIFLATHNPEAHAGCVEFLESMGYSIVQIGDFRDELIAIQSNAVG